MLVRHFRSMKVGSLVLVVGLLSVAGVLLAQGPTAPAKSAGGQGTAESVLKSRIRTKAVLWRLLRTGQGSRGDHWSQKPARLLGGTS